MEHLPDFHVLFYENFFKASPQAAALFRDVDVDTQGRKIVHMFQQLVNAHDSMDVLMKMAQPLGER